MQNPANTVFSKLPTAVRGYFVVAIKLFSLGFIFALLNYCVMDKRANFQFIVYSSGLLLLASLILSLFVLIVYFVWRKHFSKTVIAISNIITVLVVSVFVISIFAPAQFGLFDGTELSRQFSFKQHIYDALRFSGCVLGAVLLFIFLKSQFNRICNFMVFVSIIYVVIFSVKVGNVTSGPISQNRQLPEYLQKLSSWDFLGKEKNIIFVLLDAFQGSIFEAFIKENESIADDFQGFIAYTRAVSPFPFTSFSFPIILSGRFYNDIFNEYSDVLKAAYKDSFLLDAEHRGYNVKTVPYDSGTEIHFGNENQYILEKNNRAAFDLLYGALRDASARILPISVAQFILGSLSPMADPYNNIYHKRNSDDFLSSLIDNIRIGDSSKALFATHSYLTHPPILWNSIGMERRSADTVNSKYVLSEYKYVMGQLAKLFEKLRRLGVYDKSLIIVSGDHGTFGYFSEIYENMDYDPSSRGMNWRSVALHNPALLVKPPYSKSHMKIHWGAVSVSDIRKIISDYVVSDDWKNMANKNKLLNFSQNRNNVIYLTSKNVTSNYQKSRNFTKVEFFGNASKLPEVFLNYDSTIQGHSYVLGQVALVNTKSVYLKSGWIKEKSGAWSDRRKAYIEFEHRDATQSDLFLNVEACALVTEKVPLQKIVVYFNNIKIGELIFTKHYPKSSVFELKIPADVFNLQAPKKTIVFESHNPASPSAAGVWKGEYKLSIFLKQFSIFPR